MQIFFLLVPIIAGAYRYRQLDFAYRLLFYSSCLSLFNLLLYFFFKDIPGYKLSSFWNNIFNYATLLCWLPIFVFVTLSWASVRKQLLITLAFVLFCIASMLAEAYLIGLEEIRASHAISLYAIGYYYLHFYFERIGKSTNAFKNKAFKVVDLCPFSYW
jgi:hypothetical protein